MIDFGQCEIGRQTEKAMEINIGTNLGADRWVWFPKSVVEIRGHQEVWVKSWFARKNQIRPAVCKAF